LRPVQATIVGDDDRTDAFVCTQGPQSFVDTDRQRINLVQALLLNIALK
jgi:hypothetical protein